MNLTPADAAAELISIAIASMDIAIAAKEKTQHLCSTGQLSRTAATDILMTLEPIRDQGKRLLELHETLQRSSKDYQCASNAFPKRSSSTPSARRW
jgi:tetrahydromethanopterin S-methyltransferase subunit B